MAQAHAYLGVPQAHHTFKFNPSQVSWGYRQNSVSTDTIGGRVVQLLSVAVDGIQVAGMSGSRDEIQRLTDNVHQIMDYQVRTLNAVSFRVPSRRWDFKVYVTAMPQVGWDVAATAYPYQLQMEVVEDLTGVKQSELEGAALLRLYKGIGYNAEVHGGDVKGFDKIVQTVLAAGALTGTSTGGGGNGGGTSVDLQGGAKNEAALRTALKTEGARYVFGGFNPPGPSGGSGTFFDCSGLTEWAYRSVGIEIGGTANCQMVGAKKAGVFFKDRAKLEAGDLMFFDFSGNGCADHVALWVSQARGGTIFHAHSSSSPIEYSYGYDLSDWVGSARPAKNFPSAGACTCR